MTVEGYLLRSTYEDVIDIYEVNRKEAARVLMDISRWFRPGTFRPRPGVPVPAGDEPVSTGIQLEVSIMEVCRIVVSSLILKFFQTILSIMFALPQPQHKPIYYHALITEICKLSATTAGPAVGKSIRKLYSLLEKGLDVEISRRFADWFSVHMSNFAYQWVWKEWYVPVFLRGRNLMQNSPYRVIDLALDSAHPKKVFMRRAIDLEIRLSYYDRIVKTLPEAMQNPDAQVVPSETPGYDFEYESSSKSLIALLRIY